MGTEKKKGGISFVRLNEDGTEDRLSWEEMAKKREEKRHAMLAGEYSWGRWRYNPSNLCLELYDDRDEVEYQVDLERCTTSAQTLDWICQVAEKTWADDAVIAGLVRGLDDLLHPQATLCSFGSEKGPLDVKKLLGAADGG